MIRVMIVDDDPMVAELNRRYLAQAEGFQLTAIAGSSSQALQMLEETEVDLILLDIFLPGMDGLELLTKIRNAGKGVDVILVTAARDSQTISEALRHGAVDYLIKPFECERLIEALTEYSHRIATMRHNLLNQDELDKNILGKERKSSKELPKGLDRNTLKAVWARVSRIEKSFDTREIADLVGISRISVRKYLEFFESLGLIKLEVVYGYVGRPTYKYCCVNKDSEIIKKYLQR